MTDIFLHGLETIEKNDGPRPVQTIDTGIIGMVGTAPNADATIWPLNTPVAVKGFQGFPGGLGSAGTLADAVDGIFDQATRASQTIVIVRVAEGTTPAKTMANIIGSSLLKTGMHALRKAETDLQLKPKLLIVPGFTMQKPTDGISGTTISNAGINYTSAPELAVVGGGGAGASLVATINEEGGIDEVVVQNPGAGYQSAAGKATGKITFTQQPVADETVTINGTAVTFKASGATGNQVNIGANLGATLLALEAFLNASVDAGLAALDYDSTATELLLEAATGGEAGNAIAYSTTVTGATTAGATLTGGFPALSITVTGGGGTGGAVTATLGTVSNPVVAELLTLANRFRAGVIADGPNTTDEAAVAYRQDWDSDRLYIIDPFCKVMRDDQIVSEPASPRAAGLQARIDYEEGFWHSLSNHVLEGIVGAARVVEHSLSDPSVDSQYLNKNDVATIVRSPSGGLKIWGNHAASSDPLRKFWSVRRAHDAIIDSIEIAHEAFLDKPFGLQVLMDIAETVNGALRRWEALGATLGGRVWFDPALNTKETWVQGKLYVSYDAEAPAPIQHIVFMFSRNTGYYEVLADKAVREIARLSGRAI